MISEHNDTTIAKDLNILYKISRIVAENKDLDVIFKTVYKVLNCSLGLEDLCICMWDKKNGFFKSVYNENHIVKEDFIHKFSVENIINKDKFKSDVPFLYFNDSFIDVLEFKESETNFISKDTKLFFPFVEDEKVVGFVVFVYPSGVGEYITVESLITFNLLSNLLFMAIKESKIIHNLRVDNRLANAAKDIAKIIETQYELDYVIPLMGEIMDKYLANPLIYIFCKDENDNFRLSWPTSYSKRTIDPLLNDLISANKSVFSSNSYAMAVPLICDEHINGAIVGDSKIEELRDEDIKILNGLSDQCSTTIEKAKSFAETVKHATVDALTGLDNRRQLDKRLTQEVSIAHRSKRNLSLLMMDIDHFKSINDTHGHSVGDHVLRNVAKIVQTLTRDYDVAGRFGGEEFVLIMPDTNIEGAHILAERLRKKVADTVIPIGKFMSSKSDTIQLTLSIGIAAFSGEDKNPADLYEEADIALYKAKQEGRNRVILFSR
ncbi:MAG: diguanylate cyclase [Vampirovibrionia bacterium]